jgi:hypothetical protein
MFCLCSNDLFAQKKSGAKATALQELARSIERRGIREAFGVRSLQRRLRTRL